MNDRQLAGIERRVLKALSSAKIPITLCDVAYVPQLNEWQIVIATPLYDRKGPHEANFRVVKALQDEGFYKDIPIRRLTITSPDDPLVRALEQETKVKREGSVEIFLVDNKRNSFMVLFAPFVGPGGAIPAKHLVGIEDLCAFLENELFVSRSAVDEAISELKRKGETSIGNVQLTRKEVRKLGLG
jgi:hypothetical protein